MKFCCLGRVTRPCPRPRGAGRYGPRKSYSSPSQFEVADHSFEILFLNCDRPTNQGWLSGISGFVERTRAFRRRSFPIPARSAGSQRSSKAVFSAHVAVSLRSPSQGACPARNFARARASRLIPSRAMIASSALPMNSDRRSAGDVEARVRGRRQVDPVAGAGSSNNDLPWQAKVAPSEIADKGNHGSSLGRRG